MKEEIVQLARDVFELPPVPWDMVPEEDEIVAFQDDKISVMGHMAGLPKPLSSFPYFSIVGLPDEVERLVAALTEIFREHTRVFSMAVTVVDMLCPDFVKALMVAERQSGCSTRYSMDCDVETAVALQAQLEAELGPQLDGVWHCIHYLGFSPYALT